MAGNEIYIGKMLERLYGVVDKIDASTQAQIDALHDTAAILNNILANTGMQQQQTAFTGTALSAITMNSENPYLTAKSLLKYRYSESANFLTSHHGYFVWNINGTNVPRLSFRLDSNNSYTAECTLNVDLTGKNTISFDSYSTNSANKSKLEIFVGDSKVFSHGGDSITSATNINVSQFSGEQTIRFSATATTTTNMYIMRLKVGSIEIFADKNKLSYSANKIVSSGGTLARGLCKYTVSDAAQWSTLKFIGNLDGVRMWIVDNSGEIIMPLTATTNISDLSLFDFYIFYEISKPDAYISSVIFRYF